MHDTQGFIDEGEIVSRVGRPGQQGRAARARGLGQGRGLAGLGMEDVATLAAVSDPELLGEIFQTARAVKDQIYGPRLVLFAPLYRVQYVRQ